jgi:hypothetical protein
VVTWKIWGGRDVIHFGVVKGNLGQPSPSIERGGLGVQSHLFSDGPINIQHPDFRHGGSSMSRSIWFLWDLCPFSGSLLGLATQP